MDNEVLIVVDLEGLADEAPKLSRPVRVHLRTTPAFPPLAATLDDGRDPIRQLTRITRDKGALAKDDRLDALAMAVAYWAKALSVETEKVVQAKAMSDSRYNDDPAYRAEVEARIAVSKNL